MTCIGRRTTGLAWSSAGITAPAGQSQVTGIAWDPRSPAVDHAVDAGSAAWAFAVPEPEVTRTEPAAVDHAVNAGAASFAFALPEPTVTRTAAPTATLALSDFDATGLSVEFLALLERPATTDTRILYADADHGADPAQEPVEGELGIGPDETVISRIFNQNQNENLTLNDRDSPDSLDLGAYFDTGNAGAGRDLTLWVQRPGSARVGMSVTFVNGGGNYVNLECSTAFKAELNLITVGSRLFGGTRPESTGADHAVDAGAASWAFALPQPSVTRTAPGPQDHAVDAGAAAWAFALPEPAVTRTAPITQDHAVDAGAVSWAFAVAPERHVQRSRGGP